MVHMLRGLRAMSILLILRLITSLFGRSCGFILAASMASAHASSISKGPTCEVPWYLARVRCSSLLTKPTGYERCCWRCLCCLFGLRVYTDNTVYTVTMRGIEEHL